MGPIPDGISFGGVGIQWVRVPGTVVYEIQLTSGADVVYFAGVDAWLDKDRLEAGDLYDQKIRRFIKTCAVFIPIISQNTERRLEGYFRREWKLAAERAQGIAEQIAFVLPVVVDETPEYGAAVPECFLDAQWTRVVNGEPGGEFEKRVAAIVSEFRRRNGQAA